MSATPLSNSNNNYINNLINNAKQNMELEKNLQQAPISNVQNTEYPSQQVPIIRQEASAFTKFATVAAFGGIILTGVYTNKLSKQVDSLSKKLSSSLNYDKMLDMLEQQAQQFNEKINIFSSKMDNLDFGFGRFNDNAEHALIQLKTQQDAFSGLLAQMQKMLVKVNNDIQENNINISKVASSVDNQGNQVNKMAADIKYYINNLNDSLVSLGKYIENVQEQIKQKDQNSVSKEELQKTLSGLVQKQSDLQKQMSEMQKRGESISQKIGDVEQNIMYGQEKISQNINDAMENIGQDKKEIISEISNIQNFVQLNLQELIGQAEKINGNVGQSYQNLINDLSNMQKDFQESYQTVISKIVQCDDKNAKSAKDILEQIVSMQNKTQQKYQDIANKINLLQKNVSCREDGFAEFLIHGQETLDNLSSVQNKIQVKLENIGNSTKIDYKEIVSELRQIGIELNKVSDNANRLTDRVGGVVIKAQESSKNDSSYKMSSEELRAGMEKIEELVRGGQDKSQTALESLQAGMDKLNASSNSVATSIESLETKTSLGQDKIAASINGLQSDIVDLNSKNQNLLETLLKETSVSEGQGLEISPILQELQQIKTGLTNCTEAQMLYTKQSLEVLQGDICELLNKLNKTIVEQGGASQNNLNVSHEILTILNESVSSLNKVSNSASGEKIDNSQTASALSRGIEKIESDVLKTLMTDIESKSVSVDKIKFFNALAYDKATGKEFTGVATKTLADGTVCKMKYVAGKLLESSKTDSTGKLIFKKQYTNSMKFNNGIRSKISSVKITDDSPIGKTYKNVVKINSDNKEVGTHFDVIVTDATNPDRKINTQVLVYGKNSKGATMFDVRNDKRNRMLTFDNNGRIVSETEKPLEMEEKEVKANNGLTQLFRFIKTK